MSEPDLSGVDPTRLPEVRRRIAAIEAFLGMPHRTTADAIRYGGLIGLSRWQFSRLVRAWTQHRDPRLLVSGRRHPTARDYGIDARAAEISQAVIRSAGARAELASVAPEIERLCAEAGVRPPSRPTIWKLIRNARTSTEADGPPRIVVGRMWFHLPMTDAPPEAMPVLLAAVLLPERAVVAHLISTDPTRPPAIAELVARLAEAATRGAPARKLLLDATDRRLAAAALEEAGLARLPSYRRSVQRELSRAFGGSLGSLPAVYQRGLARPETRVPGGRHATPISATQAIATIEAAVAASVPRSRRIPAFDLSI